MKVLYSPTVGITDDKINYTFDKNKIVVTYLGVSDVFDFSGMPEGHLPINYADGKTMIDTKLSINPIMSAKKENGVLSVELLNIITTNATEEERFPEWIEV